MQAAVAQTPVVRILPLGDSITRGNNDVNFPNGDIPGGYRKELGNRLNSAGIDFDFVGTQTDNVASGMDPDHSGFNGFRTDQVLASLSDSLALSPDLVLMHLGTNDILQSIPVTTAAVNLDTLIGRIISAAPNRKLYVSSIIPFAQGWNGRTAAQLNAEAADYNTRLRNIVRQHAELGEKVFLVDMNAAIVLTDPDPSKNFFIAGDGIHPGQAGYNQMAAIWLKAIAPTLSDTIVNGGFETGLTGWVSSGQVVVKSGSTYTFADGVKVAAFHPQESATDGVLSQIFPTTAGTTYELAFDTAGADDASGQKLQVTLRGSAELGSQTVSVTGANGGGIAWHPQRVAFVADDASTTVTFTDRSTTGNNTGLLLDHIRLIKRPPVVATTPDTWTPLRAHPRNPHILEFRGRPTVLRTFAEHYSSVVNSNFDFVPYLSTLQRDGMNLTRAFLVGFRHDGSVFPATPLAAAPARFMQPWLRSGTSGPALDGLGKWDFSTWNEEYFTRLRTFARTCSERGVVAELTLFCTPYTSSDWQVSPFNPANNLQGSGPANRYDALRGTAPNLMAAQEAAVRRIVNEVNEFDNIYFEVLNEPFWNEPGIKDDQEIAFQNRMHEVIRDAEASLPNKHLVAHNFPQQADSMSPGFDVLNDHYPLAVAVQGPNPALAGAEALLRDHYQRDRILALDETDTTSALQTRLESWMFLFGGGAIYNGLDVPYFVYSAQDETGDSELGNSFRKPVRDIGGYMDNLDLAALRRDLSWMTGGVPTGATVQAMASPGQQYVAYFHHGQHDPPEGLSYSPIDGANHTITPAVSLSAGWWRAVWVRPSDLTILRIEEFNHSGGARTLAAVTYQEDVALRIDRTGAGDLTPPPGPTGLFARSDAAGSIRLIWNAVQAADLGTYRIYRSTGAPVPTDASHWIGAVAGDRTDFTDTTTAAGTNWIYVVTAVDLNGNESISSNRMSITSTLDNLPYGGAAWPIPGRIEAENFDNGGESVGWHDLTAGNEGGQYRPSENVDIAVTDDDSGSYQVFETEAGEWLEYTVNAAKSGKYILELRVANPQAGGRLQLEADGTDVSGTVEIPQNAGWQTVTVPDILLSSGPHVLRLAISATGPSGTAGAINWFSLNAGPAVGPTANAGADLQIVDQDNSGTEPANLSAVSSTAGDAPIQTYTWIKNGITIASGPNPSVNLTPGNHLIQLKVTDGNALESTDELLVTVRPGGFVNGSFESGYSGWTTTGNQGIQSGAPYAATDGSNLVGFNGANLTPNAVLSQTFATIAGATYTLQFDAGVLSFNTNSQSMQVTAMGNTNLLNRTITIAGPGGGTNRWLAQSFTFVADRSTTTLAFRDLSTATINLDLVLDNVRISGPPPAIPNTAPFARADAFSTNEGRALAIPSAGLLANDADPDANPLTAVANSGPQHGTLALNPNGGFTYIPAAGFYGSDGFTYRANDGTADSNIANVAITVSEVVPAPLANADSYAIDQNTALEVPIVGVLSNDSDARSRPLTAILDAGPAHGSLVLNPYGTFIYTPAADYFGTDTFTYRAHNGVLGSNTAMVTLTVTEVVPPPTSAPDSYLTTEGTVLIVNAPGLLENDSDPNSRPLSALLNEGPHHGSLVLAADGGFSYTPSVGFYGADSFTYRAYNGSSASGVTTVTLTVTEVVPSPVAMDDSFSTGEDVALTISANGVLSNDSDPRSRPLSAILDADASNGSVMFNANGSFTYTPAAGFFGTDHFTYHASNGVLDSGIVTVTITVHEVVPPPVSQADSFTTDQNVPLVVSAAGLLANDSDPRSRTLTAALDQFPMHGTVILNADGSFTYVPSENHFGTDSFTYHANNGVHDSNVAVVDINLTIEGALPDSIAIPDFYSIEEGGTLVIAPAEGVLANDTEVNSLPLAAIIHSGPVHGSLSLDADGGFRYTPSAGFFGNDSFSYHANNGATDSNITVVELRVTEVIPPPIAVADGYSTREDDVLVIPAAGLLSNDSDPRSRPLAAVLDAGPSHGTLVLNPNGSFTYIPEEGYFGPDSFTYHARNGVLDSNIVAVSLTITEVIPAPAAAPDFYQTQENTPLVIPASGVLANDSDLRFRPITAVLNAGPLHGTLNLNSDGSFVYTPSGGYFGADSFAYHARNGVTDSNVVTVTLAIAEVIPAPIAVADNYQLEANTPLAVPSAGVLANDSDPRSRALAAVLETGPATGGLVLNPDGSFTYTPARGFSGSDSFTYHNRNGFRDSASATVSLTVRPSAPLGLINGGFESGFTGWTTTGNLGIQSSAPYAAAEGTKLVAFNSANQAPNAVLFQSFGTIAGQTYTLSFDVGVLAYNTSPQTMLVSVNGTANLLSRSITVSGPGNGTNRWLPQSFTFIADGPLTTLTFRDQSTATVNLDMVLDNARVTGIANTAPFASNDSYQAISGIPLVVAAKGVLTNDNDAEANTLTALLTTSPAHGILVLNANGGFSYTPAAGYTGPDSFSYRANDGLLNSNVATVSLNVIPPPPNAAPVAAADSYSTTTGTALNIPAAGILTNDSDAESSPLTAALVSGPANGTLTLNANGGFSYTPAAGFTGSDSFTYRANDGNLDSNVAAVTIAVSGIVPGTLINGSFESGFTGWTTTGNLGIQSTSLYNATDGTKLVSFNAGNSTPNAVLSQSFATAAGQTYTLAFDAGTLAYNTNPQALQFSVTGTGSLLSQTITLNGAGNGSNRWVAQSFTFVANSSTTVLAFRDLSSSTNGLDLTLDNVRLTAVASLPNTAPAAIADSYSTIRDIALVVPSAGVLANDTDSQSDPLAAVINAGPAHGTVGLSPNGAFTYTPAAGYTGADSFTYHANDGRLDSNIATVTLNVTAPAATTLANGSFESGFTGWITSGNQGIQSAAPYAASDGSKLVAFNGGNQTPNGILSQAFATTAGQSYTLAFDAGTLAFSSSSQTLQVTVAGGTNLLTRTITLLGTGSGTSKWQGQSFTFVADGSSATLTFRDQSATTSNLDLLLDNVRITTQPLAFAAPVQINAYPPAEPAPQTIVAPPAPLTDAPSISGTPGNISINMVAATTGTYSLERSPDLVRWEWVVERKADGGDQIEFRDTEKSGELAMFYRIGFLPVSLNK